MNGEKNVKTIKGINSKKGCQKNKICHSEFISESII